MKNSKEAKDGYEKERGLAYEHCKATYILDFDVTLGMWGADNSDSDA